MDSELDDVSKWPVRINLAMIKNEALSQINSLADARSDSEAKDDELGYRDRDIAFEAFKEVTRGTKQGPKQAESKERITQGNAINTHVQSHPGARWDQEVDGLLKERERTDRNPDLLDAHDRYEFLFLKHKRYEQDLSAILTQQDELQEKQDTGFTIAMRRGAWNNASEIVMEKIDRQATPSVLERRIIAPKEQHDLIPTFVSEVDKWVKTYAKEEYNVVTDPIPEEQDGSVKEKTPMRHNSDTTANLFDRAIDHVKQEDRFADFRESVAQDMAPAGRTARRISAAAHRPVSTSGGGHGSF